MSSIALVVAAVATLIHSADFRAEGDSITDPSHAVMTVVNLRSDSAAIVSRDALNEALQQVRREEDKYFAEHGTYTVDRRNLPGYRAPLGAKIYITAGKTWLVLHGEDPRVSVQQLTVWRADAPQPMSGNLSALPD